jgi:hypothetical protein
MRTAPPDERELTAGKAVCEVMFLGESASTEDEGRRVAEMIAAGMDPARAAVALKRVRASSRRDVLDVTPRIFDSSRARFIVIGDNPNLSPP